MKQLFIVLLFISSGLGTFAQDKARLFEDYTKCYTGFLSAKGDTLWPAQFEQVQAVMHNEYISDYSWLAKYKGYYGVIDRYGKISVPFEYEEISLGAKRNEYIVYKNGKVGIVSRNGSVLIEAKYDEIEMYPFENRTYYYVKTDNQVGLMNEEHRLLFPPTYSYIHQLDDPDPHNNNASQYVIAYDTLGMFLIDTLGRKIIKERFSEIRQEAVRLDCYKWTYCFLAYSSEGKVMLFDSTGKKMSDEPYDDVYYNTVYADSCSPIGTYAFCESSKGKELLNVVTGQRSKVYADLTFLGNYHLYSKNKTDQVKKTIRPNFGILNQDLEELPIHSNYPLAMFNVQGFASTNANYFYSELEDSPKKVILDSSIVVITEFQKDERYVGEKKGRKSSFYGLLNYKTGERILPKYHQVFRREWEGKSYFWALNYLTRDNNSGELTIYDEHLTVLFHSSIKDWSDYFQGRYERCPDNKNAVIMLQNAEGFFGGINSKGDVLIPFQITHVDPRRMDVMDDYCPIYNLIVTKEGKKGVYSWKGEQLLPAEYDEVQIDELGYIQLRKDSLWTLLDLNFNEKISNCSMIIPSVKSAMRSQQRIKPTYSGNFLDGRMFFAVKDGYLYFEEDNQFKKVDSTLIVFSLPLMIINSTILVRKDGTVVDVGDMCALVHNTIFIVRKKNDFYLYASGYEKNRKAGTLLNHVKEVRTYNNNYDYLQIQLKNLRWGAYDYNTGETLLEPNYWEINSASINGKRIENNFWVAITKNQNYAVTDWMLINSKGESVFSKVVDIPFNFNRSNLAFFCTGKKFGIVDSSMTILVPAMYDQVIEKDSIFFLKKDGHWFGFRRETGLVDLKAEYIAIDPYRNGYILFGYQGIALVDKKFNFVLDYTNRETAIQNLDLMKLVGNSIMIKTSFHPTTYYVNDARPVGRLINNRHLLELTETHSTRYSLANENQYLTRFFDNGSFQINELRELDIYVLYYKNDYMSVKRIKKSTYWRNFVDNGYSNSGVTSTKNEFTTYRLTDSTYSVIELKDLFLGKSNYIQLVDDLLTTKINKRQLFGANCVNLASILSDYRKNFYLSEGGIVFCQPGNEYQNIVLTYKELGL